MIAAAAPAPAAAADACWTEPAAEAVAVRVLLSELTVAALACGMPDGYAAFVSRQQDALRRQSERLVAFYSAAHGRKQGQAKVDALVTQLANQASNRKVEWTAGYCDFMQAVTTKAADASPDDLGALARAQPHARRLLEARACKR